MASANVFISYAHADNESSDPNYRWLDRVVQHLTPLKFQDIICIDTDRNTDLGQDWDEKIQEGLSRASAAVLLVSPAFVLAKAYQAIGNGGHASSMRMQQINNANSNSVLFSDEIKWLRDNKRTSEAIDLYFLAVERNAMSPHVIANYAKTLQIVGRGEEASRIRMEQIDQGIKEPAFYNDEAFWQLEQDRNEQARDLMRLAKERGAYDAYSDSVMIVVEKRLGKQHF